MLIENDDLWTCKKFIDYILNSIWLSRIIYETEKSKFSIKYPTLRFHNRKRKIKIAYGESC